MTRFVLVRHGQTEWNRVERFRGRADIPLNETGVAQAKALALRLASWAIAAVYSSPLQRTRATGKAIARQLGLEVEPLEGLIDIDYGALQGLTPEEAEQRYPDIYRQWLREPHLVHFPQGESLAQLRERVLESLPELAESHQGETVVLVGHKIMNKVLLCAVLGLDNSRIWQIEQDEAALNIFEWPSSLCRHPSRPQSRGSREVSLGDGVPYLTLLSLQDPVPQGSRGMGNDTCHL